MTIPMLLWLFLIGHNGINGHSIKINYWNEQQSVTVTKNGEITHVNFGGVVDTGPGSNPIVYIANGYWRRKNDAESKTWDKKKYGYNADDICSFQQFVKTPFEVLDGQLDENKGYLDEAPKAPVGKSSRRRFIADEEAEGCKIDFNRENQHVTINRDGRELDVSFGEIVVKNGRKMAYVGNKQWIATDSDGHWNFKCLVYISANYLISLGHDSQFKQTDRRLSKDLIKKVNAGEWKHNGYCFKSASLLETERQLSDVNENYNMYELEITGKYINLWIIIGCVLVVLCCISLGCNAWYIKKQKNTSGTYSNVVQSDSEKVLFVQ
eukprot:448604_1